MSMPSGARSRTARSPFRSSLLTGSSNHRTANSEARAAIASACREANAPFASMNRPAFPIASRAARIRAGSRSGSLPIFIFTQWQPSRWTQPPSWSRNSASL
jgi:hypothetical protein